jgi:iron complex transport system substrate-binding protein
LILASTAGKSPDDQRERPTQKQSDIDHFSHKTEILYARGFTVEYHGNYKVVTVRTPWPGASTNMKYLLVQRGAPPPEGYDDARVIEIPSRRVITLSTTYIPYLYMLDLTDRIIGHDDSRYVFNPSVRKMIEEGRIMEVGEGAKANVELVMALEPDLIMTFHTGNEQDSYPKLVEAGLPVVVNAEWNEQDPLAMAEWIKFIALYFNREAEAELIFNRIVDEYGDLRTRTADVQIKPTVLVGAPFQGTWWMAGGRSFFARLLEDAGALYLWKDNNDTGAIPLDFEAVYARAAEAEFWINTGYWEQRADALEEDPRFNEFRAYREGRMYNNNRRVNEYGGNDYWESGRANPHKVLADLVAIFHPDLMPDHGFVYYRRLE